MERERKIVRASAVNIVGNVVLAAVKIVIGNMTGSIAITLDAIHSLTDAFGSIVTIIGTKLAGKAADHEHPFGYGRLEYVTSIIIAALVLSTGITALIESVEAISNPTTPQYGFVSLTIVAIAALVKIGLGAYLKQQGKALESGSLVASGTDSMMDGIISVATFAAGIIYLTTGVMTESWLAAIISLLICKSGVELLLETISKLLGERVSSTIADQVEKEARSVEGVRLASGVVLMDFGPDRLNGSIHVTVDGQMTVAEFDHVARAVQERAYKKCGVTLTGVTPYPDISRDETVRKIRSTIGRIVWSNEAVQELRGLYVDPQARTARFDAVVAFGAGDYDQIQAKLEDSCKAAYPNWSFEIRVLPDIGD